MKQLSTARIQTIGDFIETNCSALTRSRFAHIFHPEQKRAVHIALAQYQNQDGGFGHNLEGDFLLPDSSAIATSVAFQILSSSGASAADNLVQGGIRYLLSTYDTNHKGWFTVPKEVNNYPHASWWHYQDASGSSIDHYWGNPSAELVGYLAEYQELVPKSFLESLLQHTINYFGSFSGKMEMHELFCFLRFAKRLPDGQFQAIDSKLKALVLAEVETDVAAWKGYNAQPLDFVDSERSFLFPVLSDAVQKNLDYWVDIIEEEGIMMPPWSWESYPREWEEIRTELSGRYIVQKIGLLKNFDRLSL